jgi:hypothetical protein
MPESCAAAITLAGDLHARPAGSLAVAAAKFESAVELTVGASKAQRVAGHPEGARIGRCACPVYSLWAFSQVSAVSATSRQPLSIVRE